MSGLWISLPRSIPVQDINRLQALGFRWWLAQPVVRVPGLIEWDIAQLPLGWRVRQVEEFFLESGGGVQRKSDFINPEGFLRARIVTKITIQEGYSVAVEIIRPDSDAGTQLQQDPIPEWRQLSIEWFNAMNQATRCWSQMQLLLKQHPHLRF